MSPARVLRVLQLVACLLHLTLRRLDAGALRGAGENVAVPGSLGDPGTARAISL